MRKEGGFSTKHKPTTVSLFCGAGGETAGKELAFKQLGIDSSNFISHAVNHCELAIMNHRTNFPWIEAHKEEITQVTAQDYELKKINLLWASPSCVHHSRARGGKPREEQERSHANEVINRWIKLADVDVVMIENVPEFKDWGPLYPDDYPVEKLRNKPIRERKGEYFNNFINELKELGYIIEWRILCAADFGDPTTRRRLFMQAVKDGIQISWPEQSHADPKKLKSDSKLKPWRSAAECIDWSIPVESIFERKRRKPLVESTLRRIAAGIRKFVANDSVFIVTCNHSGNGFRGQSINQPMNTITSSHDANGIVIPVMQKIDRKIKVTAFLSSYYSNKKSKGKGDPRGCKIQDPVPTISCENRHAVVTAHVIRHFGKSIGNNLISPIGAITAGGMGKTGLVTSHLIKYHGTNIGSSLYDPVPTITSGGLHIGEVRSFLVKYYGNSDAQSINDPLGSITTNDRFGLVTIHGEEYQIVDIGLRMLEPHELATAMSFPSSYQWVGKNGKPLSKKDKVKMIGNACPVNTVAALIRNIILQRPEVYGIVQRAA